LNRGDVDDLFDGLLDGLRDGLLDTVALGRTKRKHLIVHQTHKN